MQTRLGAVSSGLMPSSAIDQVRRGLVHLCRWWMREFRASMPKRLLALFDASQSASLIIQPHETEVTVTLLDRAGREVFGKAALWLDYSAEQVRMWMADATAEEPSHEVVLRLPPGDTIEGKLTVPIAAEDQIDAIVREQIERKTPFDLDQVLFGHTATAIDAKRIEVRYVLVPTPRLQRHLDRLGLSLDAVSAITSAAEDDRAAPRIRIAPLQRGTLDQPRRFLLALTCASIACLIFGFASVLWQQQTVLRDVDRRSEAVAGSAKKVVGRLNDIRDVNHQVADLIAIRGAPRVLEIWEELARRLPSTTYLTAVEVRGQQMNLSGVSATAAGLIPLLERSAMFSQVELSGPAIADRASGREQFTMRARLRTPRILSGDEP